MHRPQAPLSMACRDAKCALRVHNKPVAGAGCTYSVAIYTHVLPDLQINSIEFRKMGICTAIYVQLWDSLVGIAEE